MLSEAQRRRCREIAAALDRGDMATWKSLEPRLTPEERGQVWEERAEQKARAERRRMYEVAASTVESDFRAAASLDDLDYWAEDEREDVEPDDSTPDPSLPNEDQPGKQWRLCPDCKGRGVDSDGQRCEKCDGRGRIEVDGSDDDDLDEGDEDDVEDDEE